MVDTLVECVRADRLLAADLPDRRAVCDVFSRGVLPERDEALSSRDCCYSGDIARRLETFGDMVVGAGTNHGGGESRIAAGYEALLEIAIRHSSDGDHHGLCMVA